MKFPSASMFCLRYLMFASLLSPFFSAVAAEGPHNFTFEGYLTDSNDMPIDYEVTLTFRIYDPGKSCTLYEEEQVLTPSEGNFSTLVGSLPGNPKRTSSDVDNSMLTVWANMGSAINGVGACTYTPSSGDSRILQTLVNGEELLPHYQVSSVPFAHVAQSLQGHTPGTEAGDLVLLESPNTLPALDGSNLQGVNASTIQGNSIGSAAGNLVQLDSGASLPALDGSNLLYVNASSLLGKNLSVSNPTDGDLLTYSGGQWQNQAIDIGDGDFLKDGSRSMTGDLNLGGNDLSGGGLISATSMSVADLNSTTINATDISATNTVSATTFSGLLLKGRAFEFWDADTNKITISAPSLSSDMTLTLPSSNGSSGQVLQTDGVGALTWVNQTADTTDDLGSHMATQNLETRDHWLSNDGGDEGLFVSVDGKVGVGQNSPQTSLDVNGAVRIGNSSLICASPVAGAQRYNSTSNKMEYCDGSGWLSLAATQSTVTGGVNLGTGVGVFSGVSAQNFEFRSISSISSGLTVGDVAGEIRLGLNFGIGLGTVAKGDDPRFSQIKGQDVDLAGLSAGKLLKWSGSQWTVADDINTTDNMGNHTATENLKMNDHWISGDGGAEGLYVDAAGKVGIGHASPLVPLDVNGEVLAAGYRVPNTTNVVLKQGSLPIFKVDATFSTFLGRNAGRYNSGVHNTSVGRSSLKLVDGQQNSAFGSQALQNLTSGDGNTTMGYNAGSSLTIGGQNVFVGSSSGYLKDVEVGNVGVGVETLQSSSGNNNTALGYQAGRNSSGDGNVFIGYGAGKNEVGSNKLVIENSDIASPLIGGDFVADTVQINGSLNVTQNLNIGSEEVATKESVANEFAIVKWHLNSDQSPFSYAVASTSQSFFPLRFNTEEFNTFPTTPFDPVSVDASNILTFKAPTKGIYRVNASLYLNAPVGTICGGIDERVELRIKRIFGTNTNTLAILDNCSDQSADGRKILKGSSEVLLEANDEIQLQLFQNNADNDLTVSTRDPFDNRSGTFVSIQRLAILP